MAKYLETVKIEVNDKKILDQLNAYDFTANHCFVNDEQVFSVPERIIVSLIPMELQPITEDNSLLFPYRVNYHIKYDVPKHCTVRTIIDKTGSYTSQEKSDIGIIWLSQHEMSVLNNTRDKRAYLLTLMEKEKEVF